MNGIPTERVTCYVAAFGATGETVYKLALRIGGCLVGVALEVGSILFVISHIDGIESLTALVFAGCLVGAWVSTGPERISYAGMIPLAFAQRPDVAASYAALQASQSGIKAAQAY